MKGIGKSKHLIIKRDVIKKFLPIIALLFVIILFAIISNGKILRFDNISRILLQSCTYIVAGLGIIFTMSLGNMDMSLDGIICLSSCLGLIATQSGNAWLMFPIILLSAVICEMLIGSINVFIGINSVIASFAISFLGKGLGGYLIGKQSKGLIVPSIFSNLYSKELFIAVTIVLIVIITVLFHYTRLGKLIMAIGANPIAAKASGINVFKYKLLAYLIAGIMMGLATLLIVLRSGSASGSTGAGFQVSVLLMMVIGGASLTGGTKEKIYSIVIGVLLYLFLENGLTVIGTDPNMIGLIEGILFIACVTMTFDREGVPYIL